MMQKLRKNISSESETGLQLYETWMIMWTSIELGEILEKI
jgi:hypothetical protein